MDYLPEGQTQQLTVGRILCFSCGIPIDGEASNNMCAGCLRSSVDITTDLPTHCTIPRCPKCSKYVTSSGTFMACEWESKELLAICLKRIKNLGGRSPLQVVGAQFTYTEPHSKRIKIKVDLQKEVATGVIVQQSLNVEFVIQSSMCDPCNRVEAKDYWKAVVQVRQKVKNRKTFLHLEQLLLKHEMDKLCNNIKPAPEGVDFYFAREQEARKFVQFVVAAIPARYETSKHLKSHDPHNNTYNYKYTYAVEIVPICKNDVVCLPGHLANALGSFSQLCVVLRVASQIQLIDPRSGQLGQVTAQTYWAKPFYSIATEKYLTEYTVIDVEQVRSNDISIGVGQECISGKHAVADVWLEKTSELGQGHSVCTRSHLGGLLSAGDQVSGFCLAEANVNDANFDKLNQERVPDVIIVKKVYDRIARRQRRNWKLKRLKTNKGEGGKLSRTNSTSSDASGGEITSSGADQDYQNFLEDLEDDEQLRRDVNIYKDDERSQKVKERQDGMDALNAPMVPVTEMLEQMELGGNDEEVEEQNG